MKGGNGRREGWREGEEGRREREGKGGERVSGDRKSRLCETYLFPPAPPHTHTQWRGHCEKTVDIFKQDISASELSVAEQLLSDHNEGIQQLGQMAETIIQEANR